MIRAATDVGGTFTDLVYLATDPETGAQEIGTAKVDTTPPDYERGVMNVIAKSGLALDEISVMAHGTTVVINALTEFSGFHGDTFNCPVEVAETRYGLYVDRLALNEGPGGEGEFRGGKGIVLEYRVRSDDCFFTCANTRNKHRPWALDGGLEGSPNYVEVVRADGRVETHAVVTTLQVNRDDVIRIHTGSGGGYGDPRRRAGESVLEDLENGFVTEERARTVYGVELSLSPSDRG